MRCESLRKGAIARLQQRETALCARRSEPNMQLKPALRRRQMEAKHETTSPRTQAGKRFAFASGVSRSQCIQHHKYPLNPKEMQQFQFRSRVRFQSQTTTAPLRNERHWVLKRRRWPVLN